MRTWFPLVAVALAFATACVSQTVETQKPKNADPRIVDFREKLNSDPTKCAHVWEQIGVHPYTRMVDGIPMVAICTITRCARCGEVRHECARDKHAVE